MRHAKFHSKDHLIKLVDSLADSGFLGFDVTGGEPTLHPDIVDVIEHATERGLSSRIITLGQWLGRKMKNTGDKLLLDALLDAGLANFLFSFHAADSEIFHGLTGESLNKLTWAMTELDRRGFSYTTNTTVVSDNYKHLPDLARYLSGHNTYLHNFIVMNAYYQWANGKKVESVQAKYGEVAPYLREAVRILEAANIAVNIRYVPMCAVAGLEKHVVGITGVRYDPYEWMNRINHYGGDPVEMGKPIDILPCDPSPGASLCKIGGAVNGYGVIAGRRDGKSVAKVFPSSCKQCAAMDVCDGIDANYLRRNGPEEFIRYIGVEHGAVLDDERLKYLAPFFVKRKPDADMKAVTRRAMKPMPVSDSPKVSVVVTCYNYGKYLADCLDSVLAQTWKNIEVILVDDGSTDDTSTIASNYPAVRYMYQPNSGQPAYPRNLGVSQSTGELVVCLDADDMIAPSYIEECVRMLQKHPEASIVFPGTQCIDADGKPLDMFCAAPYSFESLRAACTVVCASMFRREAWDATGGYKTNVRGAEDWNQWIEMGGLGYFGINLPRQLFFYRRHDDGIFETDVVPNHDTKKCQIVLNNADLYPMETVAMAARGNIADAA